MPPLLRAARPFLLPYAALLLGVGALLARTARPAAFFFVNGHHAPWADWFFSLFTNVGDGVFYGLVTVGLLWVRFRWALLSLACFLVTSAGAQVLKRLVFTGHPRPVFYFELHPGYPALHLVAGQTMNGLKSFPSGHTTTAFSVFLLLTLLAGGKRWGYGFLLLAVGVAYSRVYLAQHFVEDVLAGSVLGTGLTLATLAGLGPWLARHPQPWHAWRLRGRRLVRA